MQPTTRAELDRALGVLAKNKEHWTRLSVSDRVGILQRIRERTTEFAEDWVRTACELKGIAPGGSTSGEEWIGGPAMVIRNARLLEKSLREIGERGRPHLARGAVRSRPSGQVVARVFPHEPLDRVVYAGFSADVWMESSLEESALGDRVAATYRETSGGGRISLVLGAGNVSCIGPMDVLYKLFVENEVCILKMHPVNESIGPWIEESLSPLVNEGYLRVVYGGKEVGEYLVDHSAVDAIHITGSAEVHDSIVWGAPGGEQEAAKIVGKPLRRKEVTSELGCVTPVIVTPGRWTEKQISFQAENVASMLANNVSFNCNAAKVLITSSKWPLRRRFLQRLENVLATRPTRLAYYPGAEAKYERFIDRYPRAHQLGSREDGRLPWALIADLSPRDGDDLAYRVEAWSPILVETPLPEADVDDFLTAAVELANDRLYGTLSASLIVDPSTRKRRAVSIDRAIERLRYGSVVVNHWGGLAFGLTVTPWGAFPGHSLDEIGSGRGIVHNTALFDCPEKAVIEGPFVVKPKPAWFVTHQNAAAVGRRLVDFEARPSARTLSRLTRASLGSRPQVVR